MKYLLFIALTLVYFTTNAQQKEIIMEENTISLSSNISNPDTKTSFTWKDNKNNIYPIYKSKKGAYYIIRISKKTGKKYKQYLPKEVQIKLGRQYK